MTTGTITLDPYAARPLRPRPASPARVLDSATRRWAGRFWSSGGTYTAAHHQVVRAKIVLMGADGLEKHDDRGRLDTRSLSLRRKQFYQEGLVGLKDRQRTGRPRVFPARVLGRIAAGAPVDWGIDGAPRDRAIATYQLDGDVPRSSAAATGAGHGRPKPLGRPT